MTEENVQQPDKANANLRNRLVGSIILVAAAVIIIPSVLDGRKSAYKDDFKNVPERGEFEKVQSAKPFPKNEFEQHLPKEDLPVTDETPVDAAELVNAAQTQQQTQSQEVVNNETIAVNTVNKPIDFDSPAPAKSAQTSTQAPSETSPPKQQAPKAQTPSKADTPFTSNAWVIQLGVFGKKANVAALEKRLNDAGFATFNRDVRYNNGKVLTKVYVGPELDKSRLTKSLPQVNKLAGVNGKVAAFNVKD